MNKYQITRKTGPNTQYRDVAANAWRPVVGRWDGEFVATLRDARAIIARLNASSRGGSRGFSSAKLAEII